MAHPINVGTYSDIIKRILQTNVVCGILFLGVTCQKFAVLTVGELHMLR